MAVESQHNGTSGRIPGVKKSSLWSKIKAFFGSVARFIKKRKLLSAIIIVVLVAGVTLATIFIINNDKSIVKQPSSEVTAEYQKKLPELKGKVDSNPSDATARKNYAVALYATGDLKAAKKQYEEAVKINDKDAIAYNNLGNVYRDLGEYNKAISSYKKSIEINNKNINAYVNLANVQSYNKNDVNAAIETYKEGLKALPDDEQLSLLLGIAYEQANNTTQARETYEKILEKNDKNTAAKANLDRLNN